mmetsp:Transcript_12240/g.34423  ORF Transcript_12240/g.34423 Transcript_12240/m.34423 type:complete len:254 (-) Transcript_12240:406-1167(-)
MRPEVDQDPEKNVEPTEASLSDVSFAERKFPVKLVDGGEEGGGRAEGAGEEPRLFTPRSLVFSGFVVGQTIFNMVASFTGPLLVFWLIFSSGGPYAWNSGEVLGPIIASPWACAIASPAFAPIGMPEALEKGWFGRVDPADVRRLCFVFPFLGTAPVWRYGVVRHFVLGTQVAVVFIPAALLIARYPVGPLLEAWTQIWLSIIYITLLPLVTMPLALLAFAVEPNLQRAQGLMSDDPRSCARLLKRAMYAPAC